MKILGRAVPREIELMTTAAQVKEIRQANKDIIAGLEAVARALAEISASQREIIAALKSSSQPPAVSNLQKGTR